MRRSERQKEFFRNSGTRALPDFLPPLISAGTPCVPSVVGFQSGPVYFLLGNSSTVATTFCPAAIPPTTINSSDVTARP